MVSLFLSYLAVGCINATVIFPLAFSLYALYI
jgi:hypothetical protein